MIVKCHEEEYLGVARYTRKVVDKGFKLACEGVEMERARQESVKNLHSRHLKD